MGVSVDKTREHNLAAEIDFATPSRCERHDLFIRADRQQTSARNSHGLSTRRTRVNSPDASVVENDVRLSPLHGEQSQRTQPNQKFTTTKVLHSMRLVESAHST